MSGKITVTENPPLTVHTYTAPEDGWMVNSHLIEVQTQLIIVDAQYTLTYAHELLSYGEAPGKHRLPCCAGSLCAGPRVRTLIHEAISLPDAK
jgi:hypothetical protein